MAFEIDLGTSTFSSLRPNLNLTQYATALILPPQQTSGSMETTELREQFQRGELWVDQAPELKIHVCISVGPGHACPASTFFSQIGEIFCRSKLWLDLGLNVLFKSCNHALEPDNSTTFQLSFGLRRSTKNPTTMKARRIPARMRSTHDAIPPDGIPVAHLSTIYISLEFTRCNKQVVNGLSINASTFTELLEADIPFEKLITTDKADAFFFAEEGLLQPLLFSPKCSPLPEPPDSNTDKEFHTLFDVGFRNLIADNPRANKGIKPSKNGNSKSLSTVSPAVFSLGYREAINQRSQFIPSIASSIASILETSKNPTLRDKKNKLNSLRHPHSQTQPDLPSAGDTCTVRTAIKQCLWQIAQKQLYKPRASRNLSPLEYPSSADERYPTPDHTTLWDDEGDTDSSESDYYLGTEIDEFESLKGSQEQDIQDEGDSILSLTEDCTNLSIDMFGSTVDEDEEMDFAQPNLEDTQRADEDNAFISSSPVLRCHSACQLPQSDSEMLTSDCFEEDIDLTGPGSPPTTAISLDLNDFDDMLYEQL